MVLRITGGKFKGRRLNSFLDKSIRPMTDRVKESLFNIVGNDLRGISVLDLFSGTGGLAIECLSRGVHHVLSVERHQSAIALMKKNFLEFDVLDNVRIINNDVFKFLKEYQGEAFELILIDPPFTEKWGDAVMKDIAESHVLSDASIVAIEISRFEVVEKTYNTLKQVDQRSFGDKYLTFYKNCPHK